MLKCHQIPSNIVFYQSLLISAAMNESHGYTLRRSNSPYRGRKLSSSPRTKRRKSKISSDEQMIFDAVHVATYNDSPQHMYGKIRKFNIAV